MNKVFEKLLHNSK